MSDSPSPASFSSTTSPPSVSISLFDKHKSILAPFRDAAIGYVEGLQVVSDMAISRIAPCDMETLDLDDYYMEAGNNTCFYAVSHKKKHLKDEQIWNKDLDEDLRLPAFFTSNCSKVTYCTLQVVRKVLEDVPEVEKVSWSRQHIDPELILFDIDEDGDQIESPLPFRAHDFVTITCKDKHRFVLDITGDQFGIEEWFFTTKDYRKLYMEILPPEVTTEAAKATEVEEEDTRNPAVKTAVHEALDEVNAEWAREGVAWGEIYLLPEERQAHLRKDVAGKVRAGIKAALTS